MKKKKIAMLLAMALTLTQGAAVPAAAEELSTDMVQEVETDQDTGDADVTVEADEDLSSEEDAEVSIQDEDEEETEENSVTAEEDTAAPEEFSDGTAVGEENRIYQLNYDYADTTGNGAMLPNSQMTVNTWLMDRTDDENWKDVSGYNLELLPLNEEYKGNFDVTLNGTDIVISSHNVTGWFEFSVKVLLDGKELCTREIGFEVSEYVVLPKNITDADGNVINPEVGQRVDIVNDMKPQLVRYIDGKGDPIPVTGDNYKIVISSWEDEETGETVYDYNTEGWKWIDVEGQELPILERISGCNTQFGLTAMAKDENGEWSQIARREYDLDSLPGDNGDGDDDDDDDDRDVWHEDDTSEAESDYELWVDYADTIGNGAMLPNSQMTVTTDLVNKKDDYSHVADYKLEIVTQSKLGDAEVSSEGKNLLINSKDITRSGCCYVSVQIPDGNGGYKEAFKKDIYFSVSNLMLSPQTLVDKAGNKLNPKVGESINLAELGIGLMEYRGGQLYPIGDPDTLKIVVYSGTDDDGNTWYDYDTDGWKMQEVSGSDLPIMTRTTKNSTYFAVTALEKREDGNWEQIARKIYSFDEVDETPDTPSTPHDHIWEYGDFIKKATCTSEGSLIAKCVCGETKIVTTPATGHTEVKDAAVEATCTTEGKTEGSHCSVCGEVLTKQETIPAKGHTEVKDAAVAATSVKEGKTEGSHCSVCGTVLKKQNVVAKLTPTISLTASSLKMKTGQSTTAFKATGFATGDYVTNVTSSKPGTVKVTNVKNDGTFKLTAGKKAGSATITVSLASGKKASFKVTVQKSAVKTTKITTTTRSLTLKKGETYKKLASSIAVAPITSKEKVTYSSSNKSVATVSSKGVIKAKKAGTAKITVKSGSKKVVVTVKVTGVKTTKLSGVPETKTISKKKSFKIKAVATPKNTDEKITYKSSNKKIATVTSKGVVKVLRKGTATITVQSGSQKMTCKVTVK